MVRTPLLSRWFAGKNSKAGTPPAGKARRPRRVRPLLEELENRVVPAATWTGPASGGNWDTLAGGVAANWTGGTGVNGLPGPNDDVTIANASVTHSNVVTDQIKSLTLTTAALTLSGGTLDILANVGPPRLGGNLASTNSTFSLAGGTLQDAIVQAGTTITGTTSAGTLNGVTLNGTLDLATISGATVDVTGSLTLNSGVVQLGSSGGSYALLNFAGGSQTLGGSGTVVFGSSAANALRPSVSGTALTIGPGVLVRGQSGAIGYHANNWQGPTDVTFTNQGTIVADGPGNLTLDGLNWSNFDNGAVHGVIRATGGGTVTLARSWTNTGTFDVAAGSTLNLGGTFATATLGTVTSSGAVNLTGTLTNNVPLTLDAATGSWSLAGGTIIGGTVATAGGAALTGTIRGGTLNGVTLSGTLDLAAVSGAAVDVTGDLTLNGGLVRLGSGSGNYALLNFAGGSQTLGGSGTVVFGSSAANALRPSVSGTALTIGPGVLVRGQSGAIGYHANNWQGPTDVTFTNQGTIVADGPGNLTLDGLNWSNFDNGAVHGVIRATGGGTVTLARSWTNTGMVQAAGGTVTLLGSWSNSGTINVADLVRPIAASPTGATESGSSVTITTTQAHGFAVGQSVVIAGVGVAGYNGTFTITSVPTPTTFTYTAAPDLADSGGGTATVSSTVNVGGSFTTAGLGTFTRTGGTINIVGALDNSAPGSVLRLGSAALPGSWNLAGFNSKVTGGTIQAAGTSALIVAASSLPTLTNVTLDGGGGNASPLDMQTNTSPVNVSGKLTLKGATLPLGNAAGSTFGQLFFVDATPQTIDGVSGSPGKVLFGGSTGNLLQPHTGSVLTLGPDLTVTGATGRIGIDVQVFVNLGAVTADPAAVGLASGTIALSGTGWTNQGTIQAQNGGTILAQGTVTNFAAGTLTGGTWKAFANSTLRLIGGDITTNAAAIVLDGANASFLNDTSSADALAGFATNAAAGSFTIQSGRTFNAPASGFSNAGAVVIGSGSNFQLASGTNYTQTGGDTSVNGTLDTAGDITTFNLQGGQLDGSGTITVSTVNNSGGQVDPGVQVPPSPATPGTLSVTGNYIQSSGGALSIRLGGTANGMFDQLAVSGNVQLGGTINVALVNGFAPVAGNTFPVVTFGSNTPPTDFATKHFPTLANLVTEEQRNPTNITLWIASPITFSPGTLPASTAGVIYNQAVTAAGGVGAKTMTVGNYLDGGTGLPAPTASPNQVAFNSAPVAAGTVSFDLTATDTLGTAATQHFSFTINPAVSLAPTALPASTVGTPYTQTVTATGGTGDKAMTVSNYDAGGTGLAAPTPSANQVAFNSTPNAAGTVSFDLSATDTVGSAASQHYSFTISTISLAPATLPATTAGVLYNQTITASGGTGTKTMAVTNYVDGGTGLAAPTPGANQVAFSSTPNAAGTVGFDLTATDSVGGTTSQHYSIAVNPAVGLAPTALPPNTAGVLYSQAVTASGGTGAKAMTVSNYDAGGTGLTAPTASANQVAFNSTPAAAGTVSFDLTATDTVGGTASQHYSFTINAIVGFTPTTLPATTAGVLYNQTITATGGTGAKTMTVNNYNAGGTGLAAPTASANQVAFNATPTAGGTVSFDLTATDTVGGSASQHYSFTINAAVGLAPTTLPDSTVGAPYTQTVTATGGTGDKTMTVSNYNAGGTGLAPPTASANQVAFNSTPTAAGAVSFDLQATDTAGGTASQHYAFAINPAQPTVTITEFSSGITAGISPYYIAAGPDGNLWFTEGGGAIGRITPQGAVTEFSIPGGTNPRGITAGPDGNLWFTEPDGNRIGRITPQGTITEFSTGISPGAGPDGITAGPDGNLWFPENNVGRIGRITPAGIVTEFSIGISPGSAPDGITAGPDGNLWFTEYSLSGIGRITPQGTVTEFTTGISSGAGPDGIRAGPDGNLWFTERSDGIGRITPQGTVTEFRTGISPGSAPDGITAGPDGNLWFTENSGSRIGRITPQGAVTEFSTGISPGSAPDGIAAGPDGNLWFAEFTGNRIGRVVISANAPQLGSLAPTAWTVNQPYSGSVTVTGTGPFSNLTQSGLPPGLTASLHGSTISITGTPTAAGNFTSLQLGVTDANSNPGSNTYSLAINPAVTLTPPPLPQATVGAPYNQTITASGGTGNKTMTVSNYLDGGTGLAAPTPGANQVAFNFTPAAAGTVSFDLKATDTAGATASQHYAFAVNPAVSLAPTTLPPSTAGVLYSQTITATGGTGAKAMAVSNYNAGGTGLAAPTSGPNQVAFNSTPTAAGTVSFDLTATDTVGGTASQHYAFAINPAVITVNPPVPTPTPPSQPPGATPGSVTTAGAFDPATATWYLRKTNTPGAPDAGHFAYGTPGSIAVVGDWNGDGTTTVGVVDPATMTWYLRNSNSPGAPDIAPFRYGGPGWIPVVGDWNGDGTATVGVVDPTTMTWYLRNSNGPGAPDITPFRYGAPGWKPVAGDWNGDGITSVGVFDPIGQFGQPPATWYLKNDNHPGQPSIAPFRYGGAGWVAVAGDWSGGGTTTIGVVDPSGVWYLRGSNTPGAPDAGRFTYGTGAYQAVVGDWIGRDPALRVAGGEGSRGLALGSLDTDSLTAIRAEALRRLQDALAAFRSETEELLGIESK